MICFHAAVTGQQEPSMLGRVAKDAGQLRLFSPLFIRF
jgi:hypothetical protein